MNDWDEKNTDVNTDWRRMVEGNPIYSSYLWRALLFTLFALLGIVKVALRIHGNRLEVIQWILLLASALLIMGVYGNRALRALGEARLQVSAEIITKPMERSAFKKFRAYYFCVVMIGLSLTWLSLYL